MPATIYRFTPPTCTLEISGQKSPLSRWTANNVLKQVRFKLRFDDPRQVAARQVTIQGSEAELTQFQTIIENYVHTQLHGSFRLANQLKTKLDNSKQVASNKTTKANPPYLKPQGLTQHELFFGSLTHDSDRQKLDLSTVQLFDLVTALENYQTTVAIIPDIKQVESESKIIPLWGKIAVAAIATASIATVATLFRPPAQQNVASDRSQPESTTIIPELNEIKPPEQPNSSPAPTDPELGEPIASAKRLPPPPAVETPKPKPDIPDPADYDPSQVARQSGLESFSRRQETQPSTAPIKTEILAESSENSSEKSPKAIAQENSQPQKTNPELDLESSFSEKDQPQADQQLTAKNAPVSLSQTQEVIAYFKSNWQPPAELQQGLEYRLLIAADGSLQRVVPLGKAARKYLNQTNIPLNGESFITPVANSQPITIRLLLNPDGKVQAFKE